MPNLNDSSRSGGTPWPLIGVSAAMKEVFAILEQVETTDANVLIEGESGTGKELIARSIHQRSGQAQGPFLAINCGAMPDTLLESELFGYLKGAFTGATADKIGIVEAARGGTLLFDEISETSLQFQVKLLRLLQDRDFRPLGAVESRYTDARFIAATNRDLELLVREKKFRLDLLYRLKVLAVPVPPLRNRREDIPILIQTFLSEFSLLYRKRIRGVSPEVMKAFRNYDWPGNVRELKNCLESAFILSKSERIESSGIPAHIAAREDPQSLIPSTPLLASSQKSALQSTLQACEWNVAAAARRVGMHRVYVYTLMKKHGISRPPKDSSGQTGDVD